jgi:hypothetical protein
MEHLTSRPNPSGKPQGPVAWCGAWRECHPEVLAWLIPLPQRTFHLAATSCSWLNAPETFFAKHTKRRLPRRSIPPLATLHEMLNDFVEVYNRKRKPFVWIAELDPMAEKAR